MLIGPKMAIFDPCDTIFIATDEDVHKDLFPPHYSCLFSKKMVWKKFDTKWNSPLFAKRVLQASMGILAWRVVHCTPPCSVVLRHAVHHTPKSCCRRATHIINRHTLTSLAAYDVIYGTINHSARVLRPYDVIYGTIKRGAHVFYVHTMSSTTP